VTLLPCEVEVVYPEESEKVPEHQLNADQADDLKFGLRDYFRDRDAYVHGGLFIYYEPGNPQACVAPDVFAVWGVGKHPRGTFKVWEEGTIPRVVFEITSEATYAQDAGHKRMVYEQLDVEEYFLYDPLGSRLNPPLQGYRLVGGRYEPIESGPSGRLASQALGLELGVVDHWLRLWSPAEGAWLPTFGEQIEARRAAEARAEAAESRAAAAEAELIRLRALLQNQRD
jgi:hypothetical protein